MYKFANIYIRYSYCSCSCVNNFLIFFSLTYSSGFSSSLFPKISSFTISISVSISITHSSSKQDKAGQPPTTPKTKNPTFLKPQNPNQYTNQTKPTTQNTKNQAKSPSPQTQERTKVRSLLLWWLIG